MASGINEGLPSKVSTAMDVPEKSPVVKMTTGHARTLLARRYPAPEWAYLQEVAPATGGGTRYADAVALNLWKSRGYALHGFEIKVSRSDWQRELKDPAKAEAVYRYCDHWWIVAPSGVVKPGELPPTWGLLRMNEHSLIQEVAAPKLEAQSLTREFIASLIRRAHESLSSSAASLCEAEVARMREKIDGRIDQEVRMRTRELEGLKEKIKVFEESTGLSFDRYSGPKLEVIHLAQKLEPLLRYGDSGGLEALNRLARELGRAAKIVGDAAQASGLCPPLEMDEERKTEGLEKLTKVSRIRSTG